MTQDEAREYIELYLNKQPYIKLPVYDVVMKEIRQPTFEEIEIEEGIDLSKCFGGDAVITEYTFRELIKTAYNLKENERD